MDFANNEKFLGLILKAKRLKKGWTQEKVSEALNIPIRYLSEMETGKRMVDKNSYQRIHNYFELDKKT